MYNVALSVAACLRAGTRVDVAWPVGAEGLDIDPATDAVALTPGGGRIGGLLGGALDSHLTELAAGIPAKGRVAELTVSEVDASVAGLPHGGRVRCALVPADALPEALWPTLQAREPVCLALDVDGDEVVDATLYRAQDLEVAPEGIASLFEGSGSTVTTVDDRLVTLLRPVPQLVITGGGPIASAVADAARLLGWQVVTEPEPQMASGVIAGLSPLDSVLVIGHDVETSSRVLGAALESPVGYIGALGSQAMQQQRADWLAYRGITDLTRVHGPAGLDIGARAPQEVAVAILAEAIAAHRG